MVLVVHDGFMDSSFDLLGALQQSRITNSLERCSPEVNMKKSMWATAFLSFVFTLALTAPAIAQQTHYIVQVPFSFVVNAHVLPAGEYRVAIVSPHTVQIQGVKNSARS